MDKDVLTLIFGVGAAIALLVFGSNAYEKYQCTSYGEITGKSVHYNNFDVCYVEGRRWDEHLALVTARDGLEGLK